MIRRIAVLIATALIVGLTAPGALAITKSSMESAWIPSMCGHDAGYLVDGSRDFGLSGADWLAEPKLRVVGQIIPGGKKEGAAVVHCYAGGVGWPDNVIVWNARGKVIGNFQLGRITKGGRESISRLTLRKGVLTARVLGIGARGDAGCCGTRMARLTMKWSKAKQRVVVTKKTLYYEVKPAKKLITLAKAGKFKKMRGRASGDVISALRSLAKNANSIRLGRCIGQLDDWWPSWQIDIGGAVRGCLVYARWGEYSSVYLMGMKPSGFGRWRASGITGIAG